MLLMLDGGIYTVGEYEGFTRDTPLKTGGQGRRRRRRRRRQNELLL